MTTTRTRAVVAGSVLAVLALALSVALPAGDVRGEVHPSFDPDAHVELNRTADGIAVTWVSAAEEDGFVEWALSATNLAASPTTANDDRGDFAARLNKRTHRVNITGVTGGSTIHFNIVSGGVTDPNGPYQVTIASVALTSPPNLLTGVVRYPDSTLGLECIVSMRVTNIDPLGTGEDHHSLWVTGITNGGGYTLDITNIRGNPANAFFNNNLNAAFQYLTSADTSQITVKAQCDPDNAGQTVKTTLDAGFNAGYQNFDVQLASAPRLSIANVGVGEPAPSVTLTISTDAAATSDLTVDYATSDGTATAPDDYTATAGTATIPAGMLATTVSIPIVNDGVEEPDETFTVTLSNPTGGVAISATAGSATVTIFDDDETLVAIPGLGAWSLVALAGLLAAAVVWKRIWPTRASSQRHL